MSFAPADASGAFDVPTRDPFETIELEVPRGEEFGPVARLVVAGVATRAGLQVERLQDLELALEETLRQPPSGPTLTLAITPTSDDLEVEVGPLAAPPPDTLGLGGVLSTLVDEMRTRRSGGEVWISLRIRRPELAASRWRP